MNRSQRVFALQATFALLSFMFSAQLLNFAKESDTLMQASILNQVNTAIAASR